MKGGVETSSSMQALKKKEQFLDQQVRWSHSNPNYHRLHALESHEHQELPVEWEKTWLTLVSQAMDRAFASARVRTARVKALPLIPNASAVRRQPVRTRVAVAL